MIARSGEEKARKNAERFQYSQHMALAQIAWQESNMGRLEQLLDTCPTDYKNTWEWHYLKRQCHPDVVTFTGHSGGVQPRVSSRRRNGSSRVVWMGP